MDMKTTRRWAILTRISEALAGIVKDGGTTRFFRQVSVTRNQGESGSMDDCAFVVLASEEPSSVENGIYKGTIHAKIKTAMGTGPDRSLWYESAEGHAMAAIESLDLSDCGVTRMVCKKGTCGDAKCEMMDLAIEYQRPVGNPWA